MLNMYIFAVVVILTYEFCGVAAKSMIAADEDRKLKKHIEQIIAEEENAKKDRGE